MLRVGLTGAIASGKSTVARVLQQEGIAVLDADRVVHDLYAADQAMIDEILEAFPDVGSPNDGIDRGRLGARIFAHEAARVRLEAIVHPRVFTAIREWFAAQESGGPLVVEAALWTRLPWSRHLDLLVTVVAERKNRLLWLQKRGLSAAEAESRLDAQGTIVDRETPDHWILENLGSLQALKEQAGELARRLRVVAESRSEG